MTRYDDGAGALCAEDADLISLTGGGAFRARVHEKAARAVPHLAHVRYGIGTARRGRLTGEGVISTWPEARLRRVLRKGRAAG
ncbi:MAG TPA: hypothetical protein VFP69_01235 [Streptomyces sp.]|nr:hypothetical protein [Streptomyces sp.]